jgi:hypothetical protein
MTITETPNTPYINFDLINGTIEIKGRSLPENPLGIYEPLIQLVDEYILNPCEKTIINLEFYYINTSSSKQIFRMLKRFETLSRDNREVIVNWHYDEDDQATREDGETFESLLRIPFNFIVA